MSQRRARRSGSGHLMGSMSASWGGNARGRHVWGRSASRDRRSLQLKIAHRDLQRHDLGAGIVRVPCSYASTSQGRYNPVPIRREGKQLQQVWPAAQKPWPHRRLLLPDACLAGYAPPVAIWRIFPPSLSRDISRPPRPSISLALRPLVASSYRLRAVARQLRGGGFSAANIGT